MLNIKILFQKIREKTKAFRLTITREMARFSRTREISTPQNTDIPREIIGRPAAGIDSSLRSKSLSPDPSFCPYCNSKDFVKRGTRKKKLETVQLYLCRACNRTFTAQFIKGKHFPLNMVIEGLNYYNLGFGLEETCRLLGQKFGELNVPSTSARGRRAQVHKKSINKKALFFKKASLLAPDFGPWWTTSALCFQYII